jgi:hypothetical protein
MASPITVINAQAVIVIMAPFIDQLLTTKPMHPQHKQWT